ncbi:hypothetical protein ERX35_010315 [Macrococcus equipercicus]|uniref:Uncharacterized protein n=1 Tax=Macrococcus equipercicus TaxID=69967 RepID=A0ABQ6R6L3_9STAP|nr:hypothetical protein [Macrococcus equipercicus]KAA1036915.1 hypothetical protein ERX35_010315 [Macrococcus equipercicus]
MENKLLPNIIFISMLTFFILTFVKDHGFILMIAGIGFILIWTTIYLEQKKKNSSKIEHRNKF